MLNRFKNKLANIVNGISNYQVSKDDEAVLGQTLTPHTDVSPFPYSRPAFLNLSADEVQVSADHISRPILVPRNGSSLPWCAGYAEVINAGKTKVSEDQARSEVWTLPPLRPTPQPQADTGEESQTAAEDSTNEHKDNAEGGTVVHYFGIFDGHAGTGAALMSVNILHLIIQDKLQEVQHLLDTDVYQNGLLRQPHVQSPTTPPFSPPPQASSSASPFPADTVAGDKDKDNTELEEAPVEKTSEESESNTTDTEESEPKSDETSVELSEDEQQKPESISDEEGEDADDVDSTTNTEADPSDGPDGGSENGVVTNERKSSDATPTSSSPEVPQSTGPELSTGKVKPIFALNLEKFNVENMIIGALESSFFDMDAVICRERRVYRVPGGCTALVALFFKGKLYICNAGDSRAVLCTGGKVTPMSQDFTPETDRKRIQLMAWHHPELLCNMFCPIQFAHRVTRKDIGKRVLYRDGWRRGWSYKTVTDEDIRIPLIFGEGKKARLLGTIGVSRGFGDHDLRVYDTDVFVKPFMTCAPEVRVYDLSKETHTEDDVLIMGTDGLWDVTTNEKAASIVRTCLAQFQPDDPNRYVSAAQELVMHARGILKSGWRTSEDRIASGDDITVFVIPLLHKNTAEPATAPTLDGQEDS